MSRELHVHTHPPRSEHWRHIVEIAALTIAALWGFYVFIYQERIKPASAPLASLRTLTVEHNPLPGGKELVRVSLDIKNIGESELQLNGVVVNLYGQRFGNRGVQQTDPLPGLHKTNFALRASTPVPLYSFYDTWASLGQGKVGIITIEPGQVWTESFAVGVQSGTYDFANVSIEYCLSRPTNRVVKSRREIQHDGTSWIVIDGPFSPEFFCGYQRNGLYYPL